MALGQADYTRTPAMLPAALDCLLSNVSVATKVSQRRGGSDAKLILGVQAPQQDVETRRASYLSILAIIRQTEESCVAFADQDFSRCFHSFLDGLDDFSTDQRGDVGSWIRITCAQALPFLVRVARRVEGRLDRSGGVEAVRGLLKLVVEKLETVRVAAGPALREILETEAEELGMEAIHRHMSVQRGQRGSPPVKSSFTACPSKTGKTCKRCTPSSVTYCPSKACNDPCLRASC